MNTPRRAPALSAALLAVTALAGTEVGCDRGEKGKARGEAGAALDFLHDAAARCKRVMQDPAARLTHEETLTIGTRPSPVIEDQMETCSCQGIDALNPTKCSFVRSTTPTGHDSGITISKEINITAKDYGLNDAERFTVSGTNQDGTRREIRFVVSKGGCEVNGVSVDRQHCNTVRQAVHLAVMTIVLTNPNIAPPPSEGGPKHPVTGDRGVFE